MKISEITTRAGQACLFFIILEGLLFYWYMEIFSPQLARLMFTITAIGIAVGCVAGLLALADLAWNREKVNWQNAAFGCLGFAYAAYVTGEVMWPTLFQAWAPVALMQSAGAFAILAAFPLYKLDREHQAAPKPEKTNKRPWTLQRIAFTAMAINIPAITLVLIGFLFSLALEGFWSKHGTSIVWMALVSGYIAAVLTDVMHFTNWPARPDSFWTGIGCLGFGLASLATWALVDAYRYESNWLPAAALLVWGGTGAVLVLRCLEQLTREPAQT